MKKLLIALAAILMLAVPVAANAKTKTTSHTSTPYNYCTDTSAYGVWYRSVYLYPTGSYWQTQIASYPAYYAANNAYYQANFGC